MIARAEPTEEPEDRSWFASRSAIVLFGCAIVAAPVLGFCASVALLPHSGTTTGDTARIGRSHAAGLDVEPPVGWLPSASVPATSPSSSPRPVVSLRNPQQLASIAASPSPSASRSPSPTRSPSPSRSSRSATAKPSASPSRTATSSSPTPSPSGMTPTTMAD